MGTKNSITQEHIDEVLSKTTIETRKFNTKTTVVSAVLPNGFVIVESSSCVDPENYDHKLGIEICMKRITDKIWELEGYVLQSSLA